MSDLADFIIPTSFVVAAVPIFALLFTQWGQEPAAQVRQEQQAEVRVDVLVEALAYVDEWSRVKVLSALTPHLLKQVLEATLATVDEGSRANMLSALAPHLPDLVLGPAQAIADLQSRVLVLSALAPHLSQEQQAEVWADVLETTQNIRGEVEWGMTISALAPRLPELVLDEAIERWRSRRAQGEHPMLKAKDS